ncbi:uncharacterized protein LOC143891593 [Tasmannia lanceolata]|uniref:uncharacterized protein LOC143891593 n=1 Tax=Tasmannia lanceolata TaxID=3420 RepID=UPI0040638837
MKNTIRCCISCILPCGALDVIRIVHSTGHVEEFSKPIRAGEVMKANPKHVLKKLYLSASDGGVVSRIVIVPPDDELQRGKIYFLTPIQTLPEKTRSAPVTRKKKKKKECEGKNSSPMEVTKLLMSDQYLSEILSEKASTQRDRQRGRVGVWRPHLESISEIPTDL